MNYQRESNYIDGQWTGADEDRTIDVHDPASGEKIGVAPWSGSREATQAVLAARRAFPSWSATTAAERATFLLRIANRIRQDEAALAQLLVREQGKPIAESRSEIRIGADYIQWFAEEARRVYGDIIPSPWQDRQILVTREPVGVVAAITPWNFPFSMIARKLGAALAAGCTLVVKPSEWTPYCGLAWGILAEAAAIPSGVVNVLTGDPIAIGLVFTQSPEVNKVTFTGSTKVGRLLAERAAASSKRCTMELGGNAPFIVFDDADLDASLEGAIASKFRNSGQTCICTNRFYLQRSIYSTWLERFAQKMKGLTVGSGLDEESRIGPLINPAAVSKVEEHIADAILHGGRILVGGQRHPRGGCFFEPTLIADGNGSMRATKEETFGPVAICIPFDTEEEVIGLANDTDSGLAAYCYTADLGRAFRVSKALQFGMVGINSALITTEVAPFGGIKGSGVGREGSKYGLDDYLNLKYISLGIGRA